eukprot:m.166073 g.166073  ORF g.166073 m.166073 type:complete len:73 (+) comp31415_c1_seq2:230-448(+)
MVLFFFCPTQKKNKPKEKQKHNTSAVALFVLTATRQDSPFKRTEKGKQKTKRNIGGEMRTYYAFECDRVQSY